MDLHLHQARAPLPSDTLLTEQTIGECSPLTLLFVLQNKSETLQQFLIRTLNL